jgi:hypothetical protein
MVVPPRAEGKRAGVLAFRYRKRRAVVLEHADAAAPRRIPRGGGFSTARGAVLAESG